MSEGTDIEQAPAGTEPSRLRRVVDVRTWSLGTRLGATLVLAALVPLTIVAYATLHTSEDSIEDAELRNAVTAAEFGASTVEQFLNGMARQADEAATRTDVIDVLTGTTPPESLPLATIAPDGGDTAGVVIVGADGRVVAATTPSMLGTDVSATAWFEGAIAGRSQVSSVVAGSRPATTSVYVAAPARPPGAAVVGVLAIEVRSEAILYALHRAPMGPGAQAVLVDDDGIVVAARDHRLRYRPLAELTPEQIDEVVATSGYAVTADELEPIAGLAPVASAIATQRSGTVTDVALPGRGSQVAAFERLTGERAAVVVLQPSAVFLEPLRTLEDRVAFGAIGLGIAAVLGAVLLAMRMSRPVTAITTAARAVERGDHPDEEVLQHYGRTNDDIGRLSRVFLEMARKVEARERRLAEQVRALKVEIDEERRKREVQEVVDSDFFKDLESRAAEMRRRAKEGQ